MDLQSRAGILGIRLGGRENIRKRYGHDSKNASWFKEGFFQIKTCRSPRRYVEIANPTTFAGIFTNEITHRDHDRKRLLRLIRRGLNAEAVTTRDGGLELRPKTVCIPVVIKNDRAILHFPRLEPRLNRIPKLKSFRPAWFVMNRSNRLGDHFINRVKITFHQVWRDNKSRTDVVETFGFGVGRQHLLDRDIHSEQVANCVFKFHTIQPPQDDPTLTSPSCRHFVQLRGQPVDGPLHFDRRRSLFRRGWHLA